MSVAWLGVVIITLGIVGLAFVFATRSTAKCVDPNLDDLIKVSKKLSREQLESVKKKAESYANKQRL